jgi:membrane-bound lytic murein transglycosylase D
VTIRYLLISALFYLCAATVVSAQSESVDAYEPWDELVDTDEELLVMSRIYDHQGGSLEAAALGDYSRYEAHLDTAMQLMIDLLDNPVAERPRFRELYRSVVTEFEGYYGAVDTFTTEFGSIFAVRDSLFASLEEDDLLEDLLITELPELSTTVPIVHNSLVERSIVYLMRKPEKTVDLWRARAETYFPMIEAIMEEEDAPEELKYLALIESGLEPRARSWARAAGMWQFISATGRMYGLEVNGWVDERLDPEKSTRAAARHLKDLYELFDQDWHLALAGYNCSPGRVKRAIRRVQRATGKKPTFWDIYRYLPRETRAYVPMFMAAAIVMSHDDAFDLKEVEPGPRYEFDRVAVHHMLSLEDVALMGGVEIDAIKALNPEIRSNYVPPSVKPYMLRLPYRTGNRFIESYETWLESGEEKLDLVHVVSRGETLGRIARRHGVSVSGLRSANGLSSNTIDIGQRLRIPVSPYVSKSAEEMFEGGTGSVRYRQPSIEPVAVLSLDGSSTGPGDNITTVADRSQARAREINSRSSSSSSSGNRIRYRVRRGDTLSGIASKYKTSVRNLKNWNNLRSSRIRAGQMLTIYSGKAPARTHKVRRGENLSSIARRYGTSVSRLKSWNGLRSDRIQIGQVLTVSR